MTKPLTVERLRLGLATWAAENTEPNVDASLGSLWQRAGNYPTTPTELYLKTSATADGWTRQNLTQLKVYNVRAFGAVGDGVTSDTAAFQAAINACAAGGGGIVYIPPTTQFYLMTRIISAAPHSLEFNAIADVWILGDGPSSQIRAVGDAHTGSWWVIYIHGAVRRLRFSNFLIDGSGIFNASGNNDEHLFQLFSTNGTDHGQVLDVTIEEMFMGTSQGDGIAQKGEAGLEIQGTRVRYCMHDSNVVPFRSRSFVNAQRYVRAVQVHYNWATNTKSEIHQEPSGGSGVDSASPEEWSIVGNILVHTNPGPEAITIEGVGLSVDRRTLRSTVGSNIIIDGLIYMTESKMWTLEGNCVTYGGSDTADLEGIIHFVEGGLDLVVAGNVLVSTSAAGSPRCAVRCEDNQGFLGSQVVVADNVCDVVLTAKLLGGPGILFQNTSEVVCEGNLLMIEPDMAGTCQGIAVPTNVTATDHVNLIGNLIAVGTGNILLTAAFFAANNNLPVHNVAANWNLCDNAQNGIRFQHATTEIFDEWRSASGNNIAGLIAGSVQPQANGATIEANAGPSPQIALVTASAGPEGLVIAPIGSLCTDTAGLAGGILFVKDRGTGVSGGAVGWSRVAPALLTWGCADATTATGALFLAPGGQGLAAAVGTPIAVAIPRAGTMRTLKLACAPGTGSGTCVYTFQRNGVDTSLALTIANVGTAGTGIAATVAYAIADLATIKVTKSGAITTSQKNVQISTEFV